MTIGANVDIGPRITHVTGSHLLLGSPERAAGNGLSKPIAIRDGAQSGAGAIIFGGVTIGKSVMIAAGAMINRDVAPHMVVTGIPARP